MSRVSESSMSKSSKATSVSSESSEPMEESPTMSAQSSTHSTPTKSPRTSQRKKDVEMIDNYKQAERFLKVLSETHGYIKKRGMLNYFPNRVLDSIVELIVNMADLNIPLCDNAKVFFLNHKKSISQLFADKNRKQTRRRLLKQQNGGFVSGIVPILLSVIPSVVRSLT